ncbi:hypothetical protein ABFS83_11G106900 [Erythranthe nasuta]
MGENRVSRLEQGQTKFKTVPIAVTPEGFWCCPSPTVFHKTIKTQQNPILNKPKSSLPAQTTLVEKKQTPVTTEKKPSSNSTSSRADSLTPEQRTHSLDEPVLNPPLTNEKQPRSKPENAPPRKVSIEFGEAKTSDLKVILLGKQGLAVKLSVHRSVLVENSDFFARKISGQQPIFPCLEIDNCEDVEIYVETIGLMYCKELKQRLIKQSVSRVLRILKAGEQLGFTRCVQSCLEYLEAVPWVGEDEEDKVVSLVSHLEGEGIKVKPVLKRVSPDISSNPPNDTFSHILELVLKSKDEKARREMKSIVLKLLRENNNNNNLPSTSSTSSDSCSETIYSSCRISLDSLLSFFRQADQEVEKIKSLEKPIALEADNLLWLLDILLDRQAADEFAVIWVSQQELASIHKKLPVVSRRHISVITARLFVGIGRGEILPNKETRYLLIKIWLEALIEDYRWLQHGCGPFDRKVVEEGIGRTILTLPLEDQRSVLISWLGSFLRAGDDCPNLRGAFEVWWRRTFVRPFGAAGEMGIFRQGDIPVGSGVGGVEGVLDCD